MGILLVMTIALAVSVPATASVLGAGAPVEQQVPTNATGQTINSTNTSNATASVVLSNQTTNGTSVTVKRATLPEGGFIVLHSSSWERIGLLESSMIAVSNYLKPGTHQNITIQVNHSPPGGLANQTQFTESGGVSVSLYRDTNGNKRFDYLISNQANDTAYIVDSGANTRVAADSAYIYILGSQTPTPTASIRFLNQSTNGSTVIIESVTLPDGGFVVVHNESYLHGGDPVTTAIGLSQYLSAGTHHNVTVKLLNGSVQHTQTLVAIPSRDTNDNKRYDYVRSEGFRDVPYVAHSQVITDRAIVTVPGSASTAEPPPLTATPTTTTSSVRNGTTQPATGAAGSGGGGESNWIFENILLIGLVVVIGFLLIRLRS